VVARFAALVLAAVLSACGPNTDEATASDPVSAALNRLRDLETSRRAATDFHTEGAADDALGPDPTALAALPDGRRAVGVLRGAAAVVLLDRDGRELARAPAPRSAASVTVGPAGDVFASHPDSRVPFAQWEALVLAPAGPILWARDTYEKTGVVPYVHPAGARVPSLRPLYKKRPYFTNGSAPDLDDVLRGARRGPNGFTHAGDEGTVLLDAPSRTSLRAFLDLL
jgi:hypothetical protein